MAAQLDVLSVGYAGERVASTVVLVRDEGPAVDPLAVDQELLERSRTEVLALHPALVVPGHGAPFRPGAAQGG